ncbi:hypothetical protein M406DRAFT_289163 [Cryphonectria parasitica EP155]|uniref:G-patch domain-containing protein n=1 Tax=Cryphonectria parasitica (strain ATCC 38755 / EP155) TaxID=660469 RepID=A0A9P4Y7C0_CRYP1|nr:uncharacterized protein M406DRAFT_289163 [Cryphonectria parasitica EP155]KAF3767888.1 hypothetical protein M406DRAFT_289163 [Cryphonectria parasitica EP155]
MSEDGHDDFNDDVPLQHKRPFGSGLRRNEIKFVPASTEDPNATIGGHADAKTQGKSISNFYLNMVLKMEKDSDESNSQGSNQTEDVSTEEVCEICKLPIISAQAAGNGKQEKGKSSSRHEASIAHQVCLTHSHPPSAIVRSRMGLSVLESQGWDPDSRAGLGAAGQGVQYPLKPKPKDDHFGIGVVVPKDSQVKKKERPKLLDAKKVRKMAADDRKKTDRLQQQIFGRVDLEKYLGKGA